MTMYGYRKERIKACLAALTCTGAENWEEVARQIQSARAILSDPDQILQEPAQDRTRKNPVFAHPAFGTA